MNCREFEQYWNDWVDQFHRFPHNLDSSLAQHAAICPDCRARAEAYLKLSQAFAGWNEAPRPRVPQSLTDRITVSCLQPPASPASPHLTLTPAPPSRTRWWWGWAAAAALLATTWLGYRLSSFPQARPVIEPPVFSSVKPAKPEAPLVESPPRITLALAEATSASLELAKATSAPAARVGRRVLTSTSTSAVRTELVPRVSLGSASRALQTVGDELDAGVEPLSGTARQAFGFLLGPGSAVPESDEPSTKGSRGT